MDTDTDDDPRTAVLRRVPADAPVPSLDRTSASASAPAAEPAPAPAPSDEEPQPGEDSRTAVLRTVPSDTPVPSLDRTSASASAPAAEPASAPAPSDEKPQPGDASRTAVLRTAPPAPAPERAPAPAAGRATAPQPAAAPAGTPPRPGTPPAVPPRPERAPAVPPAAPPARRPAPFRDTAAFHLARSQDLWTARTESARSTGNADGAAPSRTRAATPPAGAPPAPTTPRTTGLPGPRAPLPPAHLPPAPPRTSLLVPARGPAPRVLAAVICLVLGVGLIGGAVAGSWLTDDTDTRPTAEVTFAKGRDAWRNTPVDALFPRTVDGFGIGPGGADRRWTRIALAPDSGCADAYDPPLAKALATAGCTRLLRATYIDATRTDLITVGAQIAKADQDTLKALHTRFTTQGLDRRAGLLPRTYPADGTPAADFGPERRASWSIRVLTDIPVIVFAVSGFADGRTVDTPQPATAATTAGATTAPAESGLGHDAKDLADRIEATFRKASGSITRTTEASS
ncbi:hypothetical protein ACIBK8_19515 [Streptomyces sp. NPDC050161]|uniref:hypothetical protein n=1 Tax=Streptomyces sp. NPDC050161 TaxID=3365604 RepID=UPI0037AD5DE2